MSSLKGSEFLLEGYYTYKDPRKIVNNSSEYVIQHYQGKHQDEYTMTLDRKVCLFQNGVLKMMYEIDEHGAQVGDFTQFVNGRVAFVQSFEDIFERRNFNRIVNHIKGERMEIYSQDSDKLIYHGEFNEKREREGWGIQYDEKSGELLLEGLWKSNQLVEIIRKFEGNIMTEFKQNGNNTIPSNRIPVYVGEFAYDESNESFIRNGVGYLINEETRIAYREGNWKNGVEVSGRNLYDGWYNPAYQKAVISDTKELNNLSFQITDLVISSNCCNNMTELDLSSCKRLSSLDIGDECFGLVKSFRIDGLSSLKSIKIGKNSFTQKMNGKGEDISKSFHILNCECLKSIVIESYSFSDFAGDFELKNLPLLQSIKIGSIENKSFNFNWSSFMIRGTICELHVIPDLPNLSIISLGGDVFNSSLCTVLESRE